MKKTMFLLIMIIMTLGLVGCKSDSKDNGNGNGNDNGNDNGGDIGNGDDSSKEVLAFIRLLTQAETDVSIDEVKWICYISYWDDGDSDDVCIYYFSYKHTGSSTQRYADVWVTEQTYGTIINYYTINTLEDLNVKYDYQLALIYAEEDQAHIESVDVTTGVMSSAQIQSTLTAAKS